MRDNTMTTLRCHRCERFVACAATDEEAQAVLDNHELHEHREHAPGLERDDDE